VSSSSCRRLAGIRRDVGSPEAATPTTTIGHSDAVNGDRPLAGGHRRLGDAHRRGHLGLLIWSPLVKRLGRGLFYAFGWRVRVVTCPKRRDHTAALRAESRAPAGPHRSGPTPYRLKVSTSTHRHQPVDLGALICRRQRAGTAWNRESARVRSVAGPGRGWPGVRVVAVGGPSRRPGVLERGGAAGAGRVGYEAGVLHRGVGG